MANYEYADKRILERNKFLLKLFTSQGYDVRIVGDNEKPSIVLNENLLLSCYVRNYDLHFTKEPLSNEIVRSFRLREEPDVTKHELQEAIELCKHKPAYRIKLDGIDDLYLVGYNYLDEQEKYPVFGKYKAKIFFDLEYAVRQLENHNNDNYSLVIV